MNPTTSALCYFFKREVPRLPTNYRWKIPTINGFIDSGKCGYLQNLELKEYLTKRWCAANCADRLQLARVIVSDWGGVRRNSDETLRNYVEEILSDDPVTPLKGIASYSKIFSIVLPEKYAIYDARVAACLNAVQINAGLRKGMAFNYVPGRNNVVGNAVTRRGFTQWSRFSVKSLSFTGWSQIKRDETYEQYLRLLSDCLKQLPDRKLAELEMALFANAECQCQLAMRAV